MMNEKTQFDRQRMAKTLLFEAPEWSDNSIAIAAGVDVATVAGLRCEVNAKRAEKNLRRVENNA